MEEKCQRLLSDNEQCDLPVAGNLSPFCHFHSQGQITDQDRGMVAKFLKATVSAKHIDFSIVNFKNYRFDKDFGRHIKETQKHVYFNACTFENCEFVKGVEFAAGVSFIHNCSFDNTNFTTVSFTGQKVRFLEASFKGQYPPFQYCAFEAPVVSFAGCHFESRAMPFPETFITAKEELLFTDVDMESDRFKIRTRDREPRRDHRCLSVYAKRIDFTGLKFNGHFEYTNIPELNDDDVEPPVIDFTGINFTQMKSATFRNANLGRARFASAVLTNIKFITPVWPDEEDRRIIFDELNPVSGVGSDELREIYAQLKKNYENNRDFVRAGQWYYRETECRRRMTPLNVRKGLCAWLHALFSRLIFMIYRSTSEYGENYPRTFSWLFGVWLFFAVVYFIDGFKFGGNSFIYTLALSTVNIWPICGDVLNALGDSFIVMAFPLFRNNVLGEPGMILYHIIQVLLTVVLLPLFLFALRRKFKV